MQLILPFFSSIYDIQSAGNIHTGPIAYSRRSVRSTSEAQNKEGDDVAKKIAEAEAEKNKMEETRKLKQQRAKEAIKNKRAKAQLAKDNQALRDEHEKKLILLRQHADVTIQVLGVKNKFFVLF